MYSSRNNSIYMKLCRGSFVAAFFVYRKSNEGNQYCLIKKNVFENRRENSEQNYNKRRKKRRL